MEAEGLCKATEELSDWLSPFLVVSIAFNIIGLMALVYFLYQVMGQSFVRVDFFLRGGLVLAMRRRRLWRRILILLTICPRRLPVLRTS